MLAASSLIRFSIQIVPTRADTCAILRLFYPLGLTQQFTMWARLFTPTLSTPLHTEDVRRNNVRGATTR